MLREVGTTNKTMLADYSQAIGKNTALILRVHRSNFYMNGFVESPKTQEIGALARRKRLPFIEDLGSGSIVPIDQIAPVAHEPMPVEILKRGVDLVCFSGDKLFGGPQAGIIAGRKRHISALKREPFFRALRCDKLILTCLQATADLYLRQDIPKQIPLFQMLRTSTGSLDRRARKILQALRGEPARIRIGHGNSRVGGGALPSSSITSVTVDIVPEKSTLDSLARALRRGKPPVIGYVESGRFCIDLRTIFVHQDQALIQALRTAIATLG